MIDLKSKKPTAIKRRLEFINLSILFFALTALLFFIVITTFFYGYHYEVEQTRIKSKVLAENVSSGVVFSDKVFSNKILQSLEHSKEVVAAIIFDKEGKRFAAYGKNKEKNRLDLKEELNDVFGFNSISIYQTIFHQEKTVGYLLIKVELTGLYKREIEYLLITIIAALLSVFIARLMLKSLSKSILEPLSHYIDVIEQITKNKNYDTKMNSTNILELNILASGFNQMLQSIKKRDENLAAYRDELEGKVKSRTEELNLAKNLAVFHSEQLSITNKELKDTQSQLVQSAKLASLGEMATGVAHEINQPLAIISMNADLRLNEIKKGKFEKIERSYETILKQISRATSIINHLRVFGRESKNLHYTLVDINQIIEDSFILLTEQFRMLSVEINRNLESNLPKISCNSIQIEQVLTNLMVNAKDALEHTKNKQISISTHLDSDFIVIKVTDTGEGITEEIIDNIFDPFFTTKEVGKGTGLGLSISYGIIQDHKGKLYVQCNPTGTTFIIELPVLKNKEI